MTTYSARKLYIDAPHKASIHDIELPPLGPKTVLARTLASTISSGTEMMSYLGTSPFINRPMTPLRTFRDRVPEDPPFYPHPWIGYDTVAVVEETGPEAKNFKVGDRFWYHQQHMTRFEFEDDAPNAHHLPEGLSTDHGTLINLCTIGMGAVLDAEVKLGDLVVIVGGGAVGQFALQLAALSGARRVFLVEPLPLRRKFAEAHCAACTGIDPTGGAALEKFLEQTGNQLPDVVIECSGSIAGLRTAIQMAGLAGRVVAAGAYAGGTEGLILGEEFLHNRITMSASMSVWGCPSRWPERWDRVRIEREVIALYAAGRVDLSGFISARFPFERAADAYELILNNPAEHMKVGLTY